MWQRAGVVVIFLSVTASLLWLSSASGTDRAPTAKLDFAKVVVDTIPTDQQDAQMLELRIEATSALRSLVAKGAQRKIQARLDALNRPN